MPRRGSSSRREKKPSSEDETKSQHNAGGSLTEISRDAVGKLLRRANKGSTSKKKTTVDFEPEQNGTRILEPIVPPKTSEVEHCSRDSIGKDSAEEKCGHVSLDEGYADKKEELDDSDWEDGTVAMDDLPMTIELNVTPDSSLKKQIRRASAEDKELAELVHKVHLLCLLARGRLIDRACDDVLIQASLLSLLPVNLFHLSKGTNLTSKALHPLISWFHDNFHVKNYTNGEKSPHFALASAIELREGSSEEIAALSVALFRALNLTARFVSILDVSPLKPDQSFRPIASGSSKGIFNTSTPMISKQKLDFKSPKKSLSCKREKLCESSLGHSRKSKKRIALSDMDQSIDLNCMVANFPSSEAQISGPESHIIDKSHKSKRRGILNLRYRWKWPFLPQQLNVLRLKKSPVKILNRQIFLVHQKE